MVEIRLPIAGSPAKSKSAEGVCIDGMRKVEIELTEIEIPGKPGEISKWTRRLPRIIWIAGITALLALIVLVMPSFFWAALWSGLKAQYLLVVMVLVFSLVAVSLLWTAGQRIDVWVFMLFNRHGKRSRWLDGLMLGITQLGNSIFAAFAIIIIYLIGDRVLAYELVLGITSLGLIVQILKVLIHRKRPYINLKDIRIVGSRDGGRSFPSGHTGQAFLMATLILQYYHLSIPGWVILYSLALLVGVTRMYVGMHYPRDVIGGAIFGIAWGLLGAIVNSYLFIVQ